MEKVFVVHSVVETDVPASVMIGDQMVEAKVPGLVVELVSKDGMMAHTHHFMSDEIAAARAMFEMGAEIVLNYSAA